MNQPLFLYILLQLSFLIAPFNMSAQEDYKLWLQYKKVKDTKIATNYHSKINGIVALGNSETIQTAIKEIQLGLSGLIGHQITLQKNTNTENMLILGNQSSLDEAVLKNVKSEFDLINNEGYIIKTIQLKNKKHILITAKTDIGVLYGVFNFLKLLQTNQQIENLAITESPRINIRMLNHWDNLDRTVDRGYAGFSLWNWQ